MCRPMVEYFKNKKLYSFQVYFNSLVWLIAWLSRFKVQRHQKFKKSEIAVLIVGYRDSIASKLIVSHESYSEI